MSFKNNVPERFEHDPFAPFNLEEDDFIIDDDGNLILDDRNEDGDLPEEDDELEDYE